MEEEKIIDAEFEEVTSGAVEQQDDVIDDPAGGQEQPPNDGDMDKRENPGGDIISNLANSKGKIEETDL